MVPVCDCNLFGLTLQVPMMQHVCQGKVPIHHYQILLKKLMLCIQHMQICSNCSSTCQRNHLPEHKRQCHQRVMERHDRTICVSMICYPGLLGQTMQLMNPVVAISFVAEAKDSPKGMPFCYYIFQINRFCPRTCPFRPMNGVLAAMLSKTPDYVGISISYLKSPKRFMTQEVGNHV